MNPQVLARSAVSVPQEVKQVGITDQIGDEGLASVNSSVIIIRWMSILFCLFFWYGFYTVVRLLLASW
jgi:hypothetical protein